MKNTSSRITLMTVSLCALGSMTSCVLYTPPQHSESIAVSQSSLDPDTSSKVLSFKPINTSDLIEINQSGIEDNSIVNIIERNGRSGDLKKSDIDRLDRANVDQSVIDAFLAAPDPAKQASSSYHYYGYRGYRPYRHYGGYRHYGHYRHYGGYSRYGHCY